MAITPNKQCNDVIGFSVRLQRNYGDWQPLGKRQNYGYNSWDFSTKECALEMVSKLMEKYEKRYENEERKIFKKFI